MAIHTIRLRAPWERKRQEDEEVWRRAFGRPTNLSERETVRLVLESESGEVIAELNGRVLEPVGSSGEPTRYDVTGMLGPRNLLTLRMPAEEAFDENRRGLPVGVWLEIESKGE